MVGSAVISSTFTLCAQAGRNHTGKATNYCLFLGKGIVSEKIIRSNKGCQYSAGAYFLLGILCGAAGFLSKKAILT